MWLVPCRWLRQRSFGGPRSPATLIPGKDGLTVVAESEPSEMISAAIEVKCLRAVALLCAAVLGYGVGNLLAF